MDFPIKSDISPKDSISIVRMQEKLSQSATDFLYDGCMEIKDWICSARKASGITQDALAEKLDVTRGNVSGWENGRHEPSLAQIKRIAQICKADVSPLFESALLPGSASLKKIVPWPFKVDFGLFSAVDADAFAELEDYIAYKVEKWHVQNHMKSKKAG